MPDHEKNEIKLVDVDALIEHLNTTMYRDVVEEIKRFPVTMKVNTDIHKFNEDNDYKITDVRDREKLLNELRPKGEWIFDAEHSFTIDLFKCSVCGSGGHTHFNFCPNCGAYMRKEKKNE